jgi:hypothetical protein
MVRVVAIGSLLFLLQNCILGGSSSSTCISDEGCAAGSLCVEGVCQSASEMSVVNPDPSGSTGPTVGQHTFGIEPGTTTVAAGGSVTFSANVDGAVCAGCKHERLVGFSCKGRAVCSSCVGRKMNELSLHLMDHVVPDVPLRQSVLTLPFALRVLVARD